MTFVGELKKLQGIEVAFVVTTFISVVGSGILTVYLFRRNLLLELDTLKLLLFAGALTLPVFAFNCVVLSVAASKTVHDKLRIFALGGGFIAMCSFYSSLLICYLGKHGFITFIIWLASLNTLMLLGVGISIYTDRDRELPGKRS